MKVRDTVSGTESWEEIKDFQQKPGGKNIFDANLTTLHGITDQATTVADLKVVLHGILTSMENS